MSKNNKKGNKNSDHKWRCEICREKPRVVRDPRSARRNPETGKKLRPRGKAVVTHGFVIIGGKTVPCPNSGKPNKWIRDY